MKAIFFMFIPYLISTGPTRAAAQEVCSDLFQTKYSFVENVKLLLEKGEVVKTHALYSKDFPDNVKFYVRESEIGFELPGYYTSFTLDDRFRVHTAVEGAQVSQRWWLNLLSDRMRFTEYEFLRPYWRKAKYQDKDDPNYNVDVLTHQVTIAPLGVPEKHLYLLTIEVIDQAAVEYQWYNHRKPLAYKGHVLFHLDPAEGHLAVP